jgi:pantetheine-phosphate adenylyltransferase
MKKLAVYPGSFDPVTNGHVDIITRGLKVFDKVIVVVSFNPSKQSLFTVEERIAMIKEAVGDNPRVSVDAFSGLIVDYMEKTKACVIIRGLRAMSDFEYEFQMALINRRLNRRVDTVFLMTSYKWFYSNSRTIKEAASFGGSVRGLVPDVVLRKLKEKFPDFNKIDSERYSEKQDDYIL